MADVGTSHAARRRAPDVRKPAFILTRKGPWDSVAAWRRPRIGRKGAERGSPLIPWFVIPANKKWFRNLAVSQILRERLEALKMAFPKPSFDVSTVDLA